MLSRLDKVRETYILAFPDLQGHFRMENEMDIHKHQHKPLDARDLDIIERTKNGEALQSIGDSYGISRERVRQLVQRFIYRGLLDEPAMNVRARKAQAKRAEKQITRYGMDVPTWAKDNQLLRKMKTRLSNLRARCKQTGVECTLQLSDIYPPPTRCPALGIELDILNALPLADNALSIDRIDPSKGYTKDNIELVSFRANKIKTDASLEEIEMVLNYYKQRILTKT